MELGANLGTLFLALAIIMMIVSIFENGELELVFALLCLAFSLMGFMWFGFNERAEIYAEAEGYVNSGYEIVLNGNKITQLPDSLKGYTVNYNHEDGIIVLTK